MLYFGRWLFAGIERSQTHGCPTTGGREQVLCVKYYIMYDWIRASAPGLLSAMEIQVLGISNIHGIIPSLSENRDFI